MISNTPTSFTEATKAKMLEEIANIKRMNEDKYQLYTGIFHLVERGCDYCIQQHTTLPTRSELKRHLKKRMNHHEKEIKMKKTRKNSLIFNYKCTIKLIVYFHKILNKSI
jgi:hypothetical protein